MSPQRSRSYFQSSSIVFVLLFFDPRIGLRRGGGHGRVHTNRQDGNSLLIFQLANEIDNLLSPAHGKRRYQNGSAMRRRILNDSLQCSFGFLGVVLAVAVGRFHKQIVAGWRVGWIVNDWLIVFAQVAGKE